jgi:peptide chain release factor
VSVSDVPLSPADMLQKSDVLSVFGGMEVHAGIIQNAAVAEGEGRSMSMEGHLSHEEYARFARLPDKELARQCHAEAFHATGPGGQGVNTADSAVRMIHVPTGITVVSRESRSQLQNRERCLEKIHEELVRRARRPKKRKKTKPTKASIARRLDAKARRSQVKKLRRRAGFD